MNAVHNPAGHGADIGPPMTPNIRLIPNAAQADPNVFPLQRARNAATDTGFTRARCTYKKKDGAGLLFLKLHHRDLLNNPVFHLIQAKVVFLQHAFRLVQVDVLRLRLAPFQGGDKVQIVIKHAGFRTVLTLLLQTVQHLLRFLLGLRVHARLFDFLLEFANVGNAFRIHFVQLPLQKFHLPLDGLFPVRLLVLIFLSALGFPGELRHLQIFVNHGLHDFHSFYRTALQQYPVLLLRRIAHPNG